MHRITRCCVALLVVACGRPADRPADETVGEAPAMDEAPAALSLADVAGTWDVRGMSPEGDSTLVEFQMVAAPDPSGWTINFPDRDPIPARASVEGDSLITEAGPYSSVLRKGVQVSIRTAARVEGDRMTGTTVARYQGGGPDSVVTLRFEGTRAR